MSSPSLLLGDGDLADEIRAALEALEAGLVRDVHRIAASLISAPATGSKAQTVVCHDERTHLVCDDGSVSRAALAAAT